MARTLELRALSSAIFKATWIDDCNLNEISEVVIVLTATAIDATRIGNCIPHQDVKQRLKAAPMALKGDLP
jgi:2-hydroxychromene-2-carboxylate isomerase